MIYLGLIYYFNLLKIYSKVFSKQFLFYNFASIIKFIGTKLYPPHLRFLSKKLKFFYLYLRFKNYILFNSLA